MLLDVLVLPVELYEVDELLAASCSDCRNCCSRSLAELVLDELDESEDEASPDFDPPP